MGGAFAVTQAAIVSAQPGGLQNPALSQQGLSFLPQNALSIHRLRHSGTSKGELSPLSMLYPSQGLNWNC